MSRLLLLLLLVGLALWWLSGRRRVPPPKPPRATASEREPQAMIACAHCGVHLPGDEALFDPVGRPFCSEAHRLAGPR